MMLLTLFESLIPFQARRQKRSPSRRSFSLEQLESRQLLAVVTSLADSGPGTLREALAGSDPLITFGVSGTIDITTQLMVNRNVVIDGAGQNVTVNNIETTKLNSRVFNVDDGTTAVLEVTIRNLTISGGTVLEGSTSTLGGGIRVNNEKLTVENCVIRENFALSGGGIGLVGTAQLTLRDSKLLNNAARSNGGGVNVPTTGSATITGSTIAGNSVGLESTLTTLAIGGGVQGFGTVVIRDSFIRNNTASTPVAASKLGYGGGVGISTGGNLTIERTEISGNVSDRGGGVSTRRAPAVIRDSVISGNTSADNGGGLRAMRSSAAPSSVTIENTTFADNVAEDGGGGIGGSVYTGSGVSTNEITISRSTLRGNQATVDGGGMELFGTSSKIENVTLSGNTAGNEGGGIWVSFSTTFTGTASLNYGTITGNSSVANGGGLYAYQDAISIRNSILSGNQASSNNGLDLFDYGYSSTTPLDVRHSLVADTTGHAVVNGVQGNLVGTPANLGALADNGGPTLTHLLLPGPGVDGADPASTIAVDQRGYGRPGANAQRDMGAVESDGTAPRNLDYNNDGKYDCADMDLLESAIDLGGPVAIYDVNGDNVLSKADVFQWLMDAGELRFGPGRFFKHGDANLDGFVNLADFAVWNANKFTTARRWCQGDFNQDNVVDGSDFSVWNANNGTSSEGGRPGSDPGLVATRRLGATSHPNRVPGESLKINIEVPDSPEEPSADSVALPTPVPLSTPAAVPRSSLASVDFATPANQRIASVLATPRTIPGFASDQRVGDESPRTLVRDAYFETLGMALPKLGG